MNKLEILMDFYAKEHLNNVFFTRLQLTNGEPGIMYIYEKENELTKFKNSFGYYLPMYVKNEDNLETFSLEKSIEKTLEIQSKRIWNESKTMPHRKISVDGIYGELFLDIYLRLILDANLLISYATKRSFNTNVETKGIDSIGYVFKETDVEFYICEAKFVSDKHTAKTELKKDISDPKIAHLSAEYLNDYFSFILEKDISCPKKDRNKIKVIFDEINRELNANENPKKFVQVIRDKNIKINFVCFAIFKCDSVNPDSIENIYSELLEEINKQFGLLGIHNYEKEIVFIPTDNKSMDIKEEIVKFYEQT